MQACPELTDLQGSLGRLWVPAIIVLLLEACLRDFVTAVLLLSKPAGFLRLSKPALSVIINTGVSHIFLLATPSGINYFITVCLFLGHIK